MLEGFPQSQEDIDKINEELKKANVNKCFEPYYAITLQASDADIIHKRQFTFVDAENGAVTNEYDRKEIIFNGKKATSRNFSAIRN